MDPGVSVISLSCHQFDKIHQETQRYIISAFLVLLKVIKVYDTEESLIYKHLNSHLIYYSLSSQKRDQLIIDLQKESPETAIDNRICILYRFNTSKEEEDGSSVHSRIEPNNVVGFLTYYYNEEEDEGLHILHLSQIYIVKEERKKGYGSMLIDYLQTCFTTPTQMRKNGKKESPLMHSNCHLPIIKVKVPIYMNTLKLFYGCGFRIIRSDITQITLKDTEILNNKIKDWVIKEDSFTIVRNQHLFNGLVREESHFNYIRWSFFMVFIFQNCSYCRKKLDEHNNLRCTICQAFLYCSRECQKLDWKNGNHKNVCRDTIL